MIGISTHMFRHREPLAGVKRREAYGEYILEPLSEGAFEFCVGDAVNARYSIWV